MSQYWCPKVGDRRQEFEVTRISVEIKGICGACKARVNSASQGYGRAQ